MFQKWNCSGVTWTAKTLKNHQIWQYISKDCSTLKIPFFGWFLYTRKFNFEYYLLHRTYLFKSLELWRKRFYVVLTYLGFSSIIRLIFSSIFLNSLFQELLGLDVLHKFNWIRLIARMFEAMAGNFAYASDIQLFINVINGSLALHAEDACILRYCMATGKKYKALKK